MKNLVLLLFGTSSLLASCSSRIDVSARDVEALREFNLRVQDEDVTVWYSRDRITRELVMQEFRVDVDSARWVRMDVPGGVATAELVHATIMSRGVGALEGLGIGVLVGSPTGALLGYATSRESDFLGRGFPTILGAVSFGLLGGVTGTVTGLIVQSKWHYQFRPKPPGR